MRHLHGLLGGDPLRKQTSLQGQGGGALQGVPAGVVHGHGGACGDLLREKQIVFVEGVLALVADEYGHPERDAAGAQWDDHERVHSEGADLHRALGVGRPPALDGFVQGAVQRGMPGEKAVGGRRGIRVVVDISRLDQRLGDAGKDGLLRCAAQTDGALAGGLGSIPRNSESSRSILMKSASRPTATSAIS